jgi:DNA-binding SARP family transcriptional activator/nucleoid-associated protein YgaU
MRAVARTLTAAGALAVLLGGVPFVLLSWGRWSITGVPSWDQIRDLPVTVVSDDAIVGLVTVALWVSWAVFVASVVAEVVAQLRGRGGSTLRLGGPVQRLASYLVGSVVIGMGPLATPTVAMPAGAAPAAGPVAAASAPNPAVPSRWSPPPPESVGAATEGVVQEGIARPAPAAEPGATIVVQRGDSPWSLAVTHLGDGTRWREIWELNRSRTQPDGAMWSNLEMVIQPGWQLVLPGEGVRVADPPPTEAPGGPVTVQPGDNFWTLAETELATAWGRAPSNAEIAGYWQSYVEGNRDRLPPPRDPNLIFPGQVFAAPAPPADPTGAPEAPPDEPEPPSDPSSQQNDGEAEPNAPTPSPEEEAPDVDESASSLPEPEDEAETEDEAEADAEPEDGAEAERTPEPEDEAGAEDETGGASTTVPSRDPAPVEPGLPGDAETEPVAQPDGGSAIWPVGLIGGGLGLAGVVVLLERRRRAQQRHRRNGHRIAMPPPDLQGGEQALQAGADVDGARLLDVALRAAATGTGAAGLPPLRWVEVTADAVLFVLEAPAPPPPGFTAPAADRWLTHGIPESLVSATTRTTTPAPTLVPLGTTADGAELLVELELSGVVTLDGPSDEVVGLLRAIAVAAATPPWSEDPDVLLVGMGGELTQLPGVRSETHLAQALATAENRADRADTALRSLRCPSMAQARAAGVTPEEWEPLVVVSAVPPTDLGDQHRLAALADRPHRAVAVVVPAPAGDVAPLGRRCTIAENGWLLVDGVDVAVQPRRLYDEDAGIVMALLEVAGQREDVPPGEGVEDPTVRRPLVSQAPPDVPAGSANEAEGGPPADEPDDGSAAEGEPPALGLAVLMAEVEVLVRVLGEVEAVRCGGPEPEKRLFPTRQRALEAVAYLALRDSTVDREDMEAALFPDGANSAKTVYNTVSAARALVGDDLFPASSGGRYELSSRVVTDYGLFCELVAQADEIEQAEVAAGLLTEALGLVKGEPFTGVGRSYAWVGPHRGMIVAQVVDAAEEVAEVRLAMGDWRAAEWAARQGLLAFPSDERMYRLLMRAASAAGNLPGVQRVFRELCDVIADPDLGVEPEDTLHPETVELLEELTGRRPKSDGKGA